MKRDAALKTKRNTKLKAKEDPKLKERQDAERKTNDEDEALDKPAAEQAQAIRNGTLTSEQLVTGYLARIEERDKKVNSILVLNSNAIAQAKAADEQTQKGTFTGPLHGIPVLLKDNIEASELPTTAGSMALVNNRTGRDAPIVANLKAAGAIILGKTNLSEWANFRSESSISGWSAVGGLTRNPHLLSRTAWGRPQPYFPPSPSVCKWLNAISN